MSEMQEIQVISQIFSPAMFRKIVRENDSSLFQRRVEKYIDIAYNSNLEALKYFYKSLQKQYRCEYIYKNKITIDIIKNYSLKDTLILNELKVGASKADLVMLNGAIKIYEIKTELDSLEKLPKQIEDYQKIAEKIYVVTDEKFVDKINNEKHFNNLGIIILDSKNKLQVFKEAKKDLSFLDFDTIFKILRKQEYIELVHDNFGYIPKVPNTIIFRACYEMLSSINIIDFQKQVLSKLKERKLANPELLKSSSTPKELKHICNSLDFNEQEYNRLYNFLKSK